MNRRHEVDGHFVPKPTCREAAQKRATRPLGTRRTYEVIGKLNLCSTPIGRSVPPIAVAMALAAVTRQAPVPAFGAPAPAVGTLAAPSAAAPKVPPLHLLDQ